MSFLLLEPAESVMQECPAGELHLAAAVGLHVRLLGPFTTSPMCPAGGPVRLALPGRAAQVLVAYLTLRRGEPQPREALASLLWGDRVTAKSRKALRQALWQVQQAFLQVGCSGLLTADEDTVTLHRSAALTADLDEVEQAARLLTHSAGPLDTDQYTLVERAATSSQREFLAGWTAEWCEWPREHYRNLHLDLLDRLLMHHEASAQPRHMLEVSAAILRLDPAHEGAHRAAMAAHRTLGNRPAALRQFERCRQTLLDELHVEPEATTLRLHADLRVVPDGVASVPVPHAAASADTLLALAHTLDEVRGMLDRCVRLLESSGTPGRRG